MNAALNPIVKWAQNRDLIFLTVEISNAVVKVFNVGENDLTFQGCGNGAQGENMYQLDMTFSNSIVPQLSTHNVSGRCILISVKKKEAKYWSKLLDQDKKPAWLKIDFDRWRGEDDSEEEMQNEITKISVEQRTKQMEKDFEQKVQDAEQEVKDLVLKGYLLVYNGLQSLAFFYITFTIIFRLVLHGKAAVPTIFDGVSDLLATCQIAAFIEPINAWFKFVHTGVLAPLAQCLGRFIVLFLVITPHNELQKDIFVVILFLSWSLIENVRYPFYSAQIVGYCPSWLLWLRYTAWIPLYPLGIVCEGALILKAASFFDLFGRWTISFFGHLSIPFSLFLRLYLVVLILGGFYLLRHMWHLRVKKYSRDENRRKMCKTKNE